MIRRWWFAVGLLGALALAGCRPAPAPKAATAPGGVPAAQECMVYVPCGLAGPYGELEAAFATACPQVKLRRKVENYVTLRDKVRDGERPDVLMNLGEKELDQLVEKGLLKKEDITRLAIMPLAVTAPPGNPLGLKTIEDLLRPEVKSIAIGDPADLSLGAATKQALEKAGLWDKLQGKLVATPKAAFTMSTVSEGKADASIAYRSCLGEVHQPGEKPGGTNLTYVCDIPGEWHDPIYATAAVVSGAAHPNEAREFVKFITREEHQAVFVKWQYDPLNKSAGQTK